MAVRRYRKYFGGRIVTPVRALTDYELTTENGTIIALSPRDPSTDPECELIDLHGLTLAPGLIDLHVHGGGDFDFMDAAPESFIGAAHAHALHGTTTLLPTSLASGEDRLLEMLAGYHAAIARIRGGDSPIVADMPGVHLEGPYFAPSQAGAQDPDCITPPIPEQVERILAAGREPVPGKSSDAGRERILRWSAAPELPGAMAFGRRLRELGILPSIGHSAAEDSVIAEAIENGFTHITHLYSCTSTIVRRNSYRFPGIIESAYIYPELTSEVIADGCHLPANILTLAYREIGPARLALVTDALRGAGMPEGPSIIGARRDNRQCIIEDGVAKLPDRSAFAGSVATGDRLVRNMMALAGATLCDAIRMMTLTPARIMGFRDRGCLTVGKRADLVLLDDGINAVRTFVAGQEVK